MIDFDRIRRAGPARFFTALATLYAVALAVVLLATLAVLASPLALVGWLGWRLAGRPVVTDFDVPSPFIVHREAA